MVTYSNHLLPAERKYVFDCFIKVRPRSIVLLLFVFVLVVCLFNPRCPRMGGGYNKDGSTTNIILSNGRWRELAEHNGTWRNIRKMFQTAEQKPLRRTDVTAGRRLCCNGRSWWRQWSATTYIRVLALLWLVSWLDREAVAFRLA